MIAKYLLFFLVVMIIGYFVSKFREYEQVHETNKEMKLIQSLLLNQSPLFEKNKPILWIHTKYERNARKWTHFYSRTTTDLNIPYIHLTVRTMIHHCGNDFNICLIDDETFSKLIPNWDIDVANVAEPMKSHYRELGMMQLLYYYGGMIVPNSTVCLKNLKHFYLENTQGNQAFVCENINRNVNLLKQKQKLLFTPDTSFMGAPKNNETIREMVEFLKRKNNNPHFSNETDFLGESSQWCIEMIQKQRMNLVLGQKIGVKTQNRKTILLEDLMEEDYLDLENDTVAIYIPREEILNRPKYQWFAVMKGEEILKSNLIVAKYLQASIVDSTNEYHAPTEQKSVVSI